MIREDARGAITLMNIAIKDQDTFGFTLRNQGARGNGQIIQDAKARGKIVMGMVCTTRQMTGDAVLQRKGCGKQCAIG